MRGTSADGTAAMSTSSFSYAARACAGSAMIGISMLVSCEAGPAVHSGFGTRVMFGLVIPLRHDVRTGRDVGVSLAKLDVLAQRRGDPQRGDRDEVGGRVRQVHDERRVVRRLDPEVLEGGVDGGIVLGVGPGHIGGAGDVEHDVVVVSGGARIDQPPPGGHEVGGHDVAAVGVRQAFLQVEGDGLPILADAPRYRPGRPRTPC